MRDPSELSDAELVEQFKSYHHTVEVAECFGTSDLLYYRELGREIDRRGMAVHTSVEVVER